MEPKFTHLHLHTEYSLLDGLCALDRGEKHHSPLMERARAQGQVALAITDHGNLFGAVHFYKAARKHGIKPMLGCEIYVTPGSHREKVLVNGKQANHLVLLAENERGFENLMKLVSKAHLDGYLLQAAHRPGAAGGAPRRAHRAVGVPEGRSGRGASWTASTTRRASSRASTPKSWGQDHFYLEVQDHGLAEQRDVNRKLVELARQLKLPLVATNDVHYLEVEHAVPHEMLLCLQTQAKWNDPDRMKYGSDQFYLKSEAEMRQLFARAARGDREHLEDRRALQRGTGAGRPEESAFPQLQVPGRPVAPAISDADRGGGRAPALWRGGSRPSARTTARAGIAKRFHFELAVIEKTGFLNYFLVVWDFIHAAKQMGIPVGPGRGSGAGSLVAYATGITGIDPLRYGLLFERFLNPDRVSPPDFDIDFCQARRGEVIEYVRRKYGADSVAQIVTYGTLGAKTLIRDIGRALEIPLPECDKLAKMIPEIPGTTLA